MEKLQPLKICEGKIVLNNLITDKEKYESEQLLFKLLSKRFFDYRTIQIYWTINEITKKGFFLLIYIDGKYSKTYPCNNLKELCDKFASICGYDALQPLSFPEGWEVIKNCFDYVNFDTLDADSDAWHFLDEDMSLFKFVVDENNYFIIDIGYYPSGNVDGKFGVRLLKNGSWENPTLDEIFTKDLDVATAKIEDIMFQISNKYS